MEDALSTRISQDKRYSNGFEFQEEFWITSEHMTLNENQRVLALFDNHKIQSCHSVQLYSIILKVNDKSTGYQSGISSSRVLSKRLDKFQLFNENRTDSNSLKFGYKDIQDVSILKESYNVELRENPSDLSGETLIIQKYEYTILELDGIQVELSIRFI
ncbi:MAG: hypothetical protein AAFQ92_27005 [Bacteroidota bacterium]